MYTRIWLIIKPKTKVLTRIHKSINSISTCIFLQEQQKEQKKEQTTELKLTNVIRRCEVVRIIIPQEEKYGQ